MTDGPRTRHAVLAHAVLEAAAWIVALCSAALMYSLGGLSGFSFFAVRSLAAGTFASPYSRGGAGFDFSCASFFLLITVVLVFAGLLVPQLPLHRLGAVTDQSGSALHARIVEGALGSAAGGVAQAAPFG